MQYKFLIVASLIFSHYSAHGMLEPAQNQQEVADRQLEEGIIKVTLGGQAELPSALESMKAALLNGANPHTKVIFKMDPLVDPDPQLNSTYAVQTAQIFIYLNNVPLMKLLLDTQRTHNTSLPTDKIMNITANQWNTGIKFNIPVESDCHYSLINNQAEMIGLFTHYKTPQFLAHQMNGGNILLHALHKVNLPTIKALLDADFNTHTPPGLLNYNDWIIANPLFAPKHTSSRMKWMEEIDEAFQLIENHDQRRYTQAHVWLHGYCEFPLSICKHILEYLVPGTPEIRNRRIQAIAKYTPCHEAIAKAQKKKRLNSRAGLTRITTLLQKTTPVQEPH